jgi:hypothetical protein
MLYNEPNVRLPESRRDRFLPIFYRDEVGSYTFNQYQDTNVEQWLNSFQKSQLLVLFNLHLGHVFF